MFTTVTDGRYALAGSFLPGDPTKGSSGDPLIVALPDGGFLTMWIEKANPFSYVPVAQRYDVDGNPVGGPVDLTGVQLDSAVLLANGDIALTWLSATTSFAIDVQLLGQDGSRIGSPLEISINTRPSSGATVGALANGGFVVTYDGANQTAYAQVLAADGTKVGGEILASEPTGYILHNDVVGLTNGNFVISWYSAGAEVADSWGNLSGGVRAQIFDPNGNKIGSAFAVNSTIAGEQDLSQLVALPSGGFAAVWRDTGQGGATLTGQQGIWAQLFDASGNKAGSQIHVSAPGDYGISPTIEVIAGTGFVVAWKSGSAFNGDFDVHARLYDFSGQPIGAEFVVSADPQSAQFSPEVAVLANGEMVFGWSNETQIASTIINSTRLAMVFGAQAGTANADSFAGSSHRVFYDGLGGDDTISGSPQADNLYGGAGADLLIAGNGNDLLDGGTGADTLVGGAGDDVYIVDDAGDVVVEYPNEGNDRVETSLLSYTLSDDVEQLTYTGTAGAALTGNALANTITGGAGNDTIDGKAGTDTMIGGAGDDIYYVDNVADVVTELANGGTDTVRTSISLTLAANVERLEFIGTGPATLKGNGSANTIVGGASNDTLTGGFGVDTLTGGAGNDLFEDTAGGLNGDIITDLSLGEKIHITNANLASFAFDLTGSTLTYTGGGTLTLQNLPGAVHLEATASAGGGVDLTLVQNPYNALSSDFNGDGRDDLLWRSDGGQVSNWLGDANGGFVSNDAHAFAQVPT
ncbi:MAG TPA: hypothetical protein VF477_15965, partial [Mycobacterium sp.]